MTTTMQIAQTIVSQIKSLDRSALMAWGATNFQALPETNENSGGLRFKVSGLSFRGWVYVKLNWLDEYEVSFVLASGEVAKTYTGVYCDMLVDIIDWVEDKKAA